MARGSLPTVLRRLVRMGRAVADAAQTAPAPGRTSGGLDTTWAGDRDGRPDPGEVVWTWVPYEDDPSQGKDRPVLLIGRRGDGTLAALQMTSQDHDADAAQEARAGRYWMDIGSGPWDAQGRPSEVRLNRLIDVREADVRREGAVLSREVYERVLEAARQYLP